MTITRLKNLFLYSVSLLLCCAFPAGRCIAQEVAGEAKTVDLTYRSTLVGGGRYAITDTYLSPFQYTGYGIGLLDERTRMTCLLDGKVSTQQLAGLEFSSSDNRTETASNYTLSLDYAYGGHYPFQPSPSLRLMAGAQGNLYAGAIYNTRNGNNPVSAKAGLYFSLSGIADYRFRIGKQPVAVRCQTAWALLGCAFSPHYGQSYYEISLGNRDGLLRFSHPGNNVTMKNYLTVELPLRPLTLRLTYLNSVYQTEFSSLKTKISSNCLFIGFAKEIFSSPAKRGLKNSPEGVRYRRVYD